MERGSAPAEKAAPPEEAATSVDKFEEYGLFIQSTEKLTDRRQLAAQLWVTLHTLLFAALGFLMKEAGASVLSANPGAAQAGGGQWTLLISTGPLIILGVFSCVIWRKMLLSYRSLIGWRYDQIMEMERSPQLQGLHGVFNREWENFFGPDARERIGFTRLEALLPTVLILVYLTFGVIASLLGLGKIAL